MRLSTTGEWHCEGGGERGLLFGAGLLLRGAGGGGRGAGTAAAEGPACPVDEAVVKQLAAVRNALSAGLGTALV